MKHKYVDERFPAYSTLSDDRLCEKYEEAVTIIRVFCSILSETKEGNDIITEAYYGK